MSLHKAINAGRVILVDDATRKVVDYTEVRDGIMYYVASDGQVLESRPIGRKHNFVCNACGERCEVAKLSGNPPKCYKGEPRCSFSEVTE